MLTFTPVTAAAFAALFAVDIEDEKDITPGLFCSVLAVYPGAYIPGFSGWDGDGGWSNKQG